VRPNRVEASLSFDLWMGTKQIYVFFLVHRDGQNPKMTYLCVVFPLSQPLYDCCTKDHIKYVAHSGSFMDIILPAALWPWGHSASCRNGYHEYFLWVKGGRRVGPQPPGTLRACPGLQWIASPFALDLEGCVV